MTASTENRPLLPQQSGMTNISFAPPNLGPPNDKKNYVFVDEHNRHRRLKVVRACDGCRRRKIKCDSATTNQWPCAACVRLKLHCIPPAVNFERNGNDSNSKLGMQGVLDFDNSSGSGDDDYIMPTHPTSMNWNMHDPSNIPGSSQPFDVNIGSFGTPPYSTPIPQQEFSFSDVATMPLSGAPSSFDDTSSYDFNHKPSLPRSSSAWSGEQYSTGDISDILGDLKINENGVAQSVPDADDSAAPYISQQKKILAEAPAYEEADPGLPKFVHTGASVRIPPELMPSDEQCMKYFDIFFTHVHPYVPVISHEDCFMDVPRLSTVQAMMILLKARESQPKRGYYYRSWITIKKIITMAHDLDLHEHRDQHRDGQSCGSDPTECLIKTRIWQTLFVLETMVGSPQGRTDMGIDPESVDLEVMRPEPGVDHSDYIVSRQFTWLLKQVFYVRRLHDLKGKTKGADVSNWIQDPKFISTGADLMGWLKSLPRDLQVDFPLDDEAPYLTSHFIGNMHSYYHLTSVMLHRPQLAQAGSYANGSWKRHMAVCYDSSKKMCKLQESILRNFGINGLLCMQRGINFVIYTVLTCTMIHLVAITSPDPDFNQDARDYFKRHMRILETCATAWPQQDMQKQINALRSAFSADTSKPFELKPEFPYGSPGMPTMQPSPPLESQYQHMPMLSRSTSHPQQTSQHLSVQPGPMTPPMTAGLDGPNDGSLYGGNSLSTSHNSSTDLQAVWNPTPIIENWNAAFGENSASMAEMSVTVSQQSPPLYHPTTLGIQNHTPMNTAMPQHYSLTPEIPPLPRSNSNQFSTNTSGDPSFVTSNMWRDTIANTYDRSALKRGWDNQSSYLDDPVQTKRAR
ncbi:uncharacterized protein KY384_008571 [Bacidia gigantensis]|uniref:uncharacterized protein n=1 Tax=Bacidia gigantensis TaxID=2732470 RepID=UPI001D03773A|nr:uncharacterized protein KY384_008571 [Bacidia gigantensis]KAG8527142.1 hypothetical protein KY384_008571 [Bacidia gigantensis]